MRYNVTLKTIPERYAATAQIKLDTGVLIVLVQYWYRGLFNSFRININIKKCLYYIYILFVVFSPAFLYTILKAGDFDAEKV